MNETIRLSDKPSRIVSLVPSQTELLFDLGLEDEVIGITKFCIYPEKWFQSKTRIGGTKNVDLEKVKALKPDLIIGNKEENSLEDIVQLRKIAPVWMSDILNLEDALNMIVEVSKLVGKSKEGETLSLEIQSGFDGLLNFVSEDNWPMKNVLYSIWNDPLMAVGKKTFVDDILQRCGLINVIEETRYPTVDIETIAPELVFLSSEPFPFNEKHQKEYENYFSNAKVILVDGEMFSWYGSRLKKAPQYFINLLRRIT